MRSDLKKRGFGLIMVLLLAAGALIWVEMQSEHLPGRSTREREEHPLLETPAAGGPQSQAASADAEREASAAVQAQSSAPAGTLPLPPSVLNSPPAAPAATIPVEQASAPGDVLPALEEVHGKLRAFRTALGENPIGTNAEITKALLGDNLKQVKLGVPDGSRLNDKGELCDRWNTPYFFHQLSTDRMEVRSAGPDRQMWTHDDRQM